MSFRLNSNTTASVLLLSSLALTALILSSEVLAYSLGDHSAFQDLPRASFDDIFFDLKIWTFNLSDCDLPLSTYRPEISCTSHLYPFAYPVYPLYLLRLLPITSTSHTFLGVALGMLSILSVSALFYVSYLRNKTMKYAAILALAAPICMLSLPFKYLIERGQIDQVVLILLVVPLLLSYDRPLKTSYSKANIIAFSCYFFGALIKIYPITAYLSNLALSLPSNSQVKPSPRNDISNRYRNVVCASTAFILFLLLCWLLYEPYLNAKASLYPDLGSHGFGLNNLLDAPYAHSWSLNKFSKIGVFLLSLALSSWSLWKPRHNALQQASSSARLFKLGNITEQCYLNVAALMPITYLFSDSINYKLSLVVILIPYLATVMLSHSLQVRVWSSLLFVCGLLSMLFAGYPSYNPSLYLYKEWMVQFFLHPLLFGGFAGIFASRFITYWRSRHVIRPESSLLGS